ncbi:MAG: hypothetical protein UV02_C0026G0004 [Candidatus Kuenenbacteria bacterium GW2011_GWA2_42_15]|uniref:SbsA Ig-like domain-containing protein n=1 Tax=Candidatus Kuenenbacteria bacterium GW2011_GWA2_42_15 TaxID=1618677 RepID=A0A0G0YY34_9BACT|nr:MAG: hypothetical protein UV02_C0026G0004 [Candidatus Kuenenbacteria bacterium GW2011_GWA2_42_15]
MLNKKSSKYYFLLATVLIVLVLLPVVFLLSANALAQTNDLYGVNYGAGAGLGSEDLRVSVIKVIRTILGVLGIVALMLILYAGFVWMTAGGKADRIEQAKKIIFNAVIGLLIIMMAFAIVQYIFKVLSGDGGGGPGPGPSCNIGDCYGCLRCVNGQNYSYDTSCNPASCNQPPWTANHFKIEAVQTAHGNPIPPINSPEKSNVFWCSKIQTVFNHDVDGAIVESAFSHPATALSDPLRIATLTSSPVVADGRWDTFGNTVVFSPKDSSFENRQTRHASHLPTILKDTEERDLSECSATAECNSVPPPDFTWDFFIGAEGDSNPPTITGAYPTKDQPYDGNVSRDPTMVVNFSENIDSTTIFIAGATSPNPANFVLEEINNSGQVVGAVNNNTLTAKMSDQSFYINLISPNLLKSFTSYRVTVKDIKDLCGNVLSPTPVVWQFTTNDQVPGVSGYYPTGNNNCPTVHPTISFNTSMADQTIEFTINNDTILHYYSLSSGQISDVDSYGTFQVTDAGDPSDPNYNINFHYRNYEFIQARDFSENTEYHISVVTTKIIDINRNVLTAAWNFSVSDLQNCVCTPNISGLNKDIGPIGDCLTIYGQCFKGTTAKPAVIAEINFDARSAFIPDTVDYQDNYVATTVPEGFSPNDRPKVTVKINYQNAAGDVPASNSREFLITVGKADGPCLWSVNPDSGDRGSEVSLSGIRFGSFGATHEVHFTPSAVAIYQVSDAAKWTDTSVQDVIVPASALDGEVKLVNGIGASNGVLFNVNFCGDGNIDAGEECDGSNVNGKTCADMGFAGGSLACSSTCKFDKSHCSNAPNVVEIGSCSLICQGGNNPGKTCSSDVDCSGTPPVTNGTCVIATNGLPSPNPGPNVSDVCLNAAISALFNVDLNTATVNATNIYLQKCNNSNCADIPADPATGAPAQVGVDPAHITASLSPSGLRSFVLTPTASLAPKTTYQVTIATGIASSAAIRMEKNYLWHFTTKESTADCPIERVYVEPRDETVSANVPTPYTAKAIASFASTNCSLINGNSYNWAWTVEDNNNPQIGVSLTGGGPNITATSGTLPGTVYIKAATEGKSDQGRLNIVIDTCAFNPSICNQNCPGSICDLTKDRCTPFINSLSPNSGPAGRWVTVQGCYFKNSRDSGHVDFGSEPVTVYPCAEKWTDAEILVQVPTTLTSTWPVTVTDQHGLISNNDRAYNFVTACAPGVPVPADGAPGVCSLNPNQGEPKTAFNISGENFSDTEDQVNFGALAAPISQWGPTSINASVPASATATSNVSVSVANCPSNGLLFTLKTGKVDDPCDGNPNNTEPITGDSICDINNNLCWSGLYCRPSDCTCQTPQVVAVISNTPTGNNVCRNSVASFIFDQTMDDDTLNNDKIKLWFYDQGIKMPSNCRPASADVTLNDITPSDNLAKKIIDKIFIWFKNNIFHSAVAQQPSSLYWWCPADAAIKADNIGQGVDGCTKPGGCTQVMLSPRKILTASENYLVQIIGGASGVRSSFGGQMAGNHEWRFKTNSEICRIDHVDIDITYKISDSPSVKLTTKADATHDYFICAGRDNCPDDVDDSVVDNQHRYSASAKSKENQKLNALYSWQEDDPDNLITASPPASQPPASLANVTPAVKSGESLVSVTASDFDITDDIHYGTSTASVAITNFICENPWPTLDQFPYTDSASNCNVGGYTADCHNMTFSTFYCRDYGQVDSKVDDLPALIAPKVKGAQSGYCVGGNKHGLPCVKDSECVAPGHCYNALKDFLFLMTDETKKKCSVSNSDCLAAADCPASETCLTNSDSLGIRVYNNSEHLSPAAWSAKYEAKPATGAPAQLDGYESQTAGRTTYVNIAIDRGDPDGIFTNMFLASYTDNAQAATTEIYRQLIENIIFNSNGITNNRACIDDATNPTGAYCQYDSECRAGETCDADKDKLARDVIRMGHLKQIIYSLGMYRGHCDQNTSLPCSVDTDCPSLNTGEKCLIVNSAYPELKAGTYKVGESVSVWDSWSQTFANVLGASPLLDPINKTVNCPSGYNDECWNDLEKDAAKKFVCPLGSHMYHYQATNNGAGYNLYANMEYGTDPNAWNPKNSGFSAVSSPSPCLPGSYNLMYSK